jgi:arginine/ornithine transport system substrate-binding protein
MKSFAAAFAVTIAASLCVASPAHAADYSKLRIAMEGGYPPFSEAGTDGKLKGFDIDIADALCAQLKAQCTQVPMDFDGMIPSLNARKVDMIIASMSITEERKRAVAFSDRYYITPSQIVAKKGLNLTVTPEGLKGKKIAVQRSTIHDRFATDYFKQSQIVRYTKQDDVFLDLASGRIEIGQVDRAAVSHGFLRSPLGKNFELVGPTFTDPKYFGEGAGVAVRKSDTELRDKLNAAIKAIRADGTYKKIADKYFDFDIYGADPVPAGVKK